jgi:hypothetical protein
MNQNPSDWLENIISPDYSSYVLSRNYFQKSNMIPISSADMKLIVENYPSE